MSYSEDFEPLRMKRRDRDAGREGNEPAPQVDGGCAQYEWTDPEQPTERLRQVLAGARSRNAPTAAELVQLLRPLVAQGFLTANERAFGLAIVDSIARKLRDSSGVVAAANGYPGDP